MAKITIKEAIKKFGKNEKTFRRWREQGLIKAEKKGRSWLLCESSIELKLGLPISDPDDAKHHREKNPNLSKLKL